MLGAHRRRRSPAMGRLLLVPRRLRARWPPAAALRVHPRRLLPLRRRRQLLLLRRGLVVGRRGLARAGRAVAARLLPHLLADAHQEGRQAADGASAALLRAARAPNHGSQSKRGARVEPRVTDALLSAHHFTHRGGSDEVPPSFRRTFKLLTQVQRICDRSTTESPLRMKPCPEYRTKHRCLAEK